MATLTGGVVYDPFTDTNIGWTPVGPVVDEWLFYTTTDVDAYVCLGVIGNRAHMAVKNKGDHTPRSTHTAIIGGKKVWPKPGFVYAIDGRVPDPERFERWFIAALRAGRYPHVKYFNINNRHYTHKNGWGAPVYSADDHLHISFMPGAERADSSILAEYEAHRTGADDVLTSKQAAELTNAAYTTTAAIPDPTGKKLPNGKPARVPLHVWAAWMTGAITALVTAVGNVDEATRAQLQQDLDGLKEQLAEVRTEVDEVPGEVAETLGTGETPEQIAGRLRKILGDKAEAVGHALANPPAES